MTDQQPSGSSDQTEARKNLPRAAKEKVNYKETRTYNKKNSDEGVDISKRSTVTSRTPPPKQTEESRQGEESDPEAENTDGTLSNIDNEKHSTPNQTLRDIENSDEDSDNVDDLLSSRVDKDHTLHLKTPIKTEIAPQIQHQPESVYSGFDNRGFPYGSPLTNPFLYPPFMNAGPGLPNWFFANPQAQAMPLQNQNPNIMQGSTPTITMVDSKSEN